MTPARSSALTAWTTRTLARRRGGRGSTTRRSGSRPTLPGEPRMSEGTADHTKRWKWLTEGEETSTATTTATGTPTTRTLGGNIFVLLEFDRQPLVTPFPLSLKVLDPQPEFSRFCLLRQNEAAVRKRLQHGKKVRHYYYWSMVEIMNLPRIYFLGLRFSFLLSL